MMKTKMYEDCPVCMGRKFATQRVKYKDGFKEVQTTCWACRGTGFVNYTQEEEITAKRIGQMYDALRT